MRILDLFSGLGGFSRAFIERGHDVITIDIEERFNPTIVADVMSLGPNDFPEGFDVILASPPCQAFSVASISTHWTGGKKAYIPKTRFADYSIRLVKHTMNVIDTLSPRYSYMENPRGVLRKIIGRPSKTIWLCRFGDDRAKPTDLWGSFAPMDWPPRCWNRNPSCHHERASRGAKTGTQGRRSPEERALIPHGLSLAICLACEGNPKGRVQTLLYD